jgi:hypothetical protein
MDSWVLFQLAVDIALFAIVIVYILKDNQSSGAAAKQNQGGDSANGEDQVDLEQLETLMDELARLVMRAEKAAQRIESGLGAESQLSEPTPPAKPKPQVNPANDAYKKATKLIKKGLGDDEISKMVGLPIHEISLIRNMAT